MKAKKDRAPIPKRIAAEILYLSDRTCCVCNEKGKSIQIHHVDEDPNNNVIENLAVLCFDCHEETQIKGGFSRKLDLEQVIKYKSEWIDRVKKRRDYADNLISLKTSGSEIKIQVPNEVDLLDNSYLEHLEANYEHEKTQLENYLLKIAEIKKTVYKYAEPKFDTGITTIVNDAAYEVIDFYEEILNEFAKFYPYNHFDNDPKKFFNEKIASCFNWHREINETYGIGRGGTMVSVIVSDCVMAEVDIMVKDMASALIMKYGIDFKNWYTLWDEKNNISHNPV